MKEGRKLIWRKNTCNVEINGKIFYEGTHRKKAAEVDVGPLEIKAGKGITGNREIADMLNHFLN